jgi:predicted MFS family arabinose efflux permease
MSTTNLSDPPADVPTPHAVGAADAGGSSAAPLSAPAERLLLFLVGAVQFVNILDFMMVMPLGPDFAAALAIPTSHLGFIGGSYTAAAAVAGVLGARWLDRFDRRSALALAMLGLVVATAAGGLAIGLKTLMLARILAGMCGGPATSLSLSIIADVIPAERRGRAMGAVMGAFSAASVFGVPLGLELARHGGWRLPFFSVAGLGLLVVTLAVARMPSLRLHLERRAALARLGGLPRPLSLGGLLHRPVLLLALAATSSTMLAVFMTIPNLSAYLQFNLGYPRARLGLLYLAGGFISFFSMRVAGKLVDRAGATFAATIGTVFIAADLAVLGFGFGHAWMAPAVGRVGGVLASTLSWVTASSLLARFQLQAATSTSLIVFVLFVGYMVAQPFRNVAHSTLASRVPQPHERAGFLSLQSSAQHLASALGAFVSAQLLVERPDHSLVGMERVIVVSIAVTVLLPILLALAERRVASERG